MLALLGLATVGLLLALIMSRVASPLVALIMVPAAAAIAGGFGLTTGQFILAGIQQIASVAAMFVFAILYFAFFVLMPFYSRHERTKPVPTRVTP